MKPQPGKPKQSHRGKGKKVNSKNLLELNYSKKGKKKKT